MAIITGFGPTSNLQYGLRALAYLGGSPSPQQRQCLVGFLMRMKTAGVHAPATRLLGRNIVLVAACGHIIELRKNETVVHDITPGILP